MKLYLKPFPLNLPKKSMGGVYEKALARFDLHVVMDEYIQVQYVSRGQFIMYEFSVHRLVIFLSAEKNDPYKFGLP